MKASPFQVTLITNAIAAHGGMPKGATMRQRWDALWLAVAAGDVDVNALYNAGLTDEHIDTVLRRLAK